MVNCSQTKLLMLQFFLLFVYKQHGIMEPVPVCNIPVNAVWCVGLSYKCGSDLLEILTVAINKYHWSQKLRGSPVCYVDGKLFRFVALRATSPTSRDPEFRGCHTSSEQ